MLSKSFLSLRVFKGSLNKQFFTSKYFVLDFTFDVNTTSLNMDDYESGVCIDKNAALHDELYQFP